MILQQHFLSCLAHASYLIGDEETGTAVVVDPQRDIDQYLREAKDRNLQIRHVFLTHFHADFLAGHLDLRERTGATIHLGAHAQADFDFEPEADGGTLQFGNVRLGFLETPGHTPEGICILVYDLQKDPDKPHAVLTGDTLFIGDVGRPDLMASIGVTAEELAGQLYHSLHDKLLRLPDETLVYPAHGAGSLCGKNISDETVSTIGTQRRMNHALQPMSKADFVSLLTANLPAAPSYFSHDAKLNRQEHQTLEKALASALRPLPLDETLCLQNAGAQLLDSRTQDQFAAGHLIGSVNIPLDGKYASWAGTLLDEERPIVLVTGPDKEQESALRLGRIGFDQVTGYLDKGASAFEARPELLTRHQRIEAGALQVLLDGPDAPLVLDVRGPGERQRGHIEGSLHIPLNELLERMDEVPRDRPVVTHCATGYRSSIAASLLQLRGVEAVTDLEGGYDAWQTGAVG